MPGPTIRCAVAVFATAAAVLCPAGAAAANPAGPCADVPYVGVCVPLSEAPSPPAQQSRPDAFIPDADGAIQAVN